MTSIVLQLQEMASSSESSESDLLRKARMVATKLKLDEFNSWLEHELHGYPQDADVPDYRIFFGDLRARNPANNVLMPIRFNAETTETLSRIHCRESVGTLVELTKSENGELQMPLSYRELQAVHQMMDNFHRQWVLPFRWISPTQLTNILDRIRSIILDWSLKLESQGIVGTGMTFSDDEKKRAATQHISIGNFQGVLGDVSHSELSQNLKMEVVSHNLESLRGFLKEARVPAKEIAELEAAIKTDPHPTKKVLGPRVGEWLGRVVTGCATGAYELTIGAGGDLMANAIWKFYGF